MKNTLKMLALSVFIAAAPIMTVVSCSGCGSLKATSYKTLSIIATSVEAGMNAFADAVVAGKVPAATQAKVKEIHDKKYQPALQAAIVAARFDTEQPAPADLKALADELLTLIVEAVK